MPDETAAVADAAPTQLPRTSGGHRFRDQDADASTPETQPAMGDRFRPDLFDGALHYPFDDATSEPQGETPASTAEAPEPAESQPAWNSVLSGANQTQPWWTEHSTAPFAVEPEAGGDVLGRPAEISPAEARVASDLMAADGEPEEEQEDDEWSAVEAAFEPRRGRPAVRQLSREPLDDAYDEPAGHSRRFIAVVLALLALIVLSTVGSDFFKDVVAAEDPLSPAQSATCAAAGSSASGRKAADLQRLLASAPSGFTTVADHWADTGAVDFSKAIKAQPDAASALAVLDQTRFQRGYDRAFSGPDSARATVAVYEFGSAPCAADFVALHAGGAGFDVVGIEGASGSVETVAAGQALVVRVARGERAAIVTWQGGDPTQAVAGVTALAATQVAALSAA